MSGGSGVQPPRWDLERDTYPEGVQGRMEMIWDKNFGENFRGRS